MFIAALMSMFPITDNATPTVILVLSSGGVKVEVRLYAVVVLYIGTAVEVVKLSE